MGGLDLKRTFFIDRDKWMVEIFFDVGADDINELADELRLLHCPRKEIIKASRVIMKKNKALTFSCLTCRKSVLAFSRHTSIAQLLNSVVHEAKHLQSAVCKVYEVAEDGEQAAYLIGYIVQNIYQIMKWKS